MGRTTKYIALWVGATALTVTLSWLGVRGVLRTAVFEQPTAVSAVRPTISASSKSPSPSLTAAQPSTAESTPAATPRRTVPASRSPLRPGASQPAANTSIRSVDVRGGRAVLSLTADSAKLVSAMPESGYRTEVSRNIGWLRVDFISGQRWSSVIASWYQRAPTIEVYEQ